MFTCRSAVLTRVTSAFVTSSLIDLVPSIVFHSIKRSLLPFLEKSWGNWHSMLERTFDPAISANRKNCSLCCFGAADKHLRLVPAVLVKGLVSQYRVTLSSHRANIFTQKISATTNFLPKQSHRIKLLQRCVVHFEGKFAGYTTSK